MQATGAIGTADHERAEDLEVDHAGDLAERAPEQDIGEATAGGDRGGGRDLGLDRGGHQRVDPAERGAGRADRDVGAADIEDAVGVEVAGEQVLHEALGVGGFRVVERGRYGGLREGSQRAHELREVDEVLLEGAALLEGVGEEEALGAGQGAIAGHVFGAAVVGELGEEADSQELFVGFLEADAFEFGGAVGRQEAHEQREEELDIVGVEALAGEEALDIGHDRAVADLVVGDGGDPLAGEVVGERQELEARRAGAVEIDDDGEGRLDTRGRAVRLKRFRAKWEPVGVKKTRQNNNPEIRF